MFVPHNLKRKMDEENNCFVKVAIKGKLSYCFLARLHNVTAAKWTDCRMALLQYGLTAICLYCNMTTAIWPTAIWRRQNDALPSPSATSQLQFLCLPCKMQFPRKKGHFLIKYLVSSCSHYCFVLFALRRVNRRQKRGSCKFANILKVRHATKPT